MTKADLDRAMNELDVLCDLAKQSVRSYTPIGFGAEYVTAEKAMLEALNEVPKTFRRMIQKAQRAHKWGLD